MQQLIVIILAVIQLNVYFQTIPGTKEYTCKQIDTITLKIRIILTVSSIIRPSFISIEMHAILVKLNNLNSMLII